MSDNTVWALLIVGAVLAIGAVAYTGVTYHAHKKVRGLKCKILQYQPKGFR